MNLLHFMWLSYSFIVSFSGINFLYVKGLPEFLRQLYAFGKVKKSIKKGENFLKIIEVPKSGINFLYVKGLPEFLRQLYAFGKVKKSIKKGENFLKIIEVPKRCFSHFYIFASLYIPLITAAVCFKYFGFCTCSLMNKFIDIFSSQERYSNGTVCPESVIIVSVMVSLQVIRRCYECQFISVYSDSKMNILHYIVGITFYFGVGLSLIHDAPGFESNSDSVKKIYVTGQWLLMRHIIGVILFIMAWFLQFDTHKRFAALRKKGEKVVSLNHHMPSGGAFEYVSCPHYFAEIVMYCSACIILGGNSYTWWLVCLWTVTNQIFTGLISHRWYQEKFKDYPSNRKAVIPFLL